MSTTDTVATVTQQDLPSPTETSRYLPTGIFVHEHQLATGPTDQDYIVLRLMDDILEVAPVDPPADDATRITFGERTPISYRTFLLEYEPQYGLNGEPVWAY